MLNMKNICLVICSLGFIHDTKSLQRLPHSVFCHCQPLVNNFIMKPSSWKGCCCQILDFSYEPRSGQSGLWALFHDGDSLPHCDSCKKPTESDPYVKLHITYRSFDKWQSVSVIAHSAHCSSGEWFTAVRRFSFESFSIYTRFLSQCDKDI